MDQDLIQLIVALGGIATFIISVVVGILFFTYSGPPPAKNVLLRDFLNLFASVSFVVFTTGFAYLSIAARPNYAWMGLLMAVFSLVFITTTLVAQALETASVLGKAKPADPTLVGSGAEGAIVLYGPVARMLTAAMLVVAGVLVLGTAVVASWLGWAAFAVAALHLALVPTIFSGYEPARFYSINGIGIPTAGGLMTCWMLLCSIALLI